MHEFKILYFLWLIVFLTWNVCMQVCTTWRAVYRSDPLWHRLTNVIWGRTHCIHATWRDEYIFRHRTAQNFHARRSTHHVLHFVPSDEDAPDGLICRCLVLSDTHLACGFADGTVRLFDLATRQHVNNFRPHHRDRFGRFSRAVSGIIISDSRIIFATLVGDIHVGIIDGGPEVERAHTGNVVDDGALVDFTGCWRWWVDLYAGVPGRAFRIWDANNGELVYVNTTLTDPEAVRGWHMLTEETESIGRVRMTSQESAVACTSLRYMVLDLRNRVFPMHDRPCRRGIIVTSFDTNNEAFMMVDSRGLAMVRRADTLEELCRFRVNVGGQRNVVVMGCMNLGYALICAEGVIRVWDIEQGRGQHLYRFSENVGDVIAMVADDTHVAAACSDTSIHLWDFSPQQG